MAKRKPTIFIGNGGGKAPVIYIEDLIDLCIVAAAHPKAHNQVFNAVFEPAPTWRQYLGAYSQLAGHQSWLGIPIRLLKPIAALIASLASTDSPLKLGPVMIDYLNRYTNYKTTKARNLLGWQAKTDYQTGVANCVPWLREQGLLD